MICKYCGCLFWLSSSVFEHEENGYCSKDCEVDDVIVNVNNFKNSLSDKQKDMLCKLLTDYEKYDNLIDRIFTEGLIKWDKQKE